MMLKLNTTHWSRRVMAGAVGLVALHLAACSSMAPMGGRPLVGAGAVEGGAAAAPMVISSNRARDTAAYVESEEQLSEADWRVLEQFGPGAVWERLAAKAAAEE